MTPDYTHIRFPGEGKIILPGVPGITNRGYLGYCTIFLFRFQGGWALFDTGHQSDRHLLLQALKGAGLSPGEITFVFLSHLHFDHCLNLPVFPQAEVFLSEAEIEYAEAVTAGQLEDYSIPDHWPRLLEGRYVHRVREVMDLGDGMSLRLLPGHTPGGLGLFFDTGPRIAVCGDAVKNAWEAAEGRSNKALAGEEAAARSIQAVREFATIIIPGHDRPFIMSGSDIHFLEDLDWEVRATIWPDEPDRTLFRLRTKGE